MKTERTPEQRLKSTFKCIKSRCYNPNNSDYKYYGGLGITVSPVWPDGNSFVQWAMANGYQPGMHLIREDKKLPFGPDNCKWVSAKESRRTCGGDRGYYVEYKGERILLPALVERFYPGYSHQLLFAIKMRISYLGWDVESAVTIPISRPGQRPTDVTRVRARRRYCEGHEDGIRKGKLLTQYYSLRQKFKDSKDPGYKHYGALGLNFSPEWADDAHAFVEWALVNGYQLGYHLVRINKRGLYGPGNCQWLSWAERKRVHADAQYVEYKGEQVFLLDLLERLYPDHGPKLVKQIKTRIQRLGWDLERALTTPVHPAGMHVPQKDGPSLLKIDKQAIEWLL